LGRTIRLLAIAVTSLLLAQSLHAQDYGSYLDAAYPENGPGAAAIVVKGGEVAYRDARGMANLELGVPLSPDHVFRLGSISKQFTAGAILLLADRGRLSVEDPISKYLPDYPTHGHTITIENLLTHTSGIFNISTIPGWVTGSNRIDHSVGELIDVFDEYPMDFAPGEQWKYSNSGYILLAAIVEAVSGQSYAEFVQENIFEPLGMKNSHHGGQQLIPGRVAGYKGPKGEHANANFISMTVPLGGGSLLSTVDDLWRWNDGLFNGDLLKEPSLARMTTGFTLNNGESTGYGYGLHVGSWQGEPEIRHGGAIPGFRSISIWLPESEVFVAVLSNDQGTAPKSIARQMAAAAVGKPDPERSAIELSPEKPED
jgi:CubicO group peptidase (beta-lactamase class C family)